MFDRSQIGALVDCPFLGLQPYILRLGTDSAPTPTTFETEVVGALGCLGCSRGDEWLVHLYIQFL